MTAPGHLSPQSPAEPSELQQVADTLEHCRQQLTLCAETGTTLDGMPYRTWRKINTALIATEEALTQLAALHITPRPVAPETEGEADNEAPRRVRVVKRRLSSNWYWDEIGTVYDVEGLDADGDYFVYDGQVLRCLLAADCEAVERWNTVERGYVLPSSKPGKDGEG